MRVHRTADAKPGVDFMAPVEQRPKSELIPLRLDKLQKYDKQGQESAMGLSLQIHPSPRGNSKYSYTY